MNAAAGRPRLHPAILATAGLVAAAAFAFSADSWVQLAEIAGFRTHWTISGTTLYLSWLMPLAFDAYTALATWQYFTARTPAFRQYAKLNALGSAALSVIVQGAYHGLKANEVDVASKWPLVVMVGAIPAGLLAAVVHLIAESLRDRQHADPAPVELDAVELDKPAGSLDFTPPPARPVEVPPPARWVTADGRAHLPIARRAAQADPVREDSARAPLTVPTIVLPRTGTGWPTHPAAQPVAHPVARTNGHPVARANGAPARTPRARDLRPTTTKPRTPSRTTVAHPRTPDDLPQRVRDYKLAHPDASARAIARELGCSDSTVRTHLKEMP